ncbi:MAG: hypothetical protein J6Z34_04585 [Clostridia bacterium]|nr:hypothetical protein [Clostridia bacterium]
MGKDKDFILKNGNKYYLFCHDMPMKVEANVVLTVEGDHNVRLKIKDGIKSVKWLDNGKRLDFVQNGDDVIIGGIMNEYGESYVVRVAEITVE